MHYARTQLSNSTSKALPSNMAADRSYDFTSPKHAPLAVTSHSTFVRADQPVLPRWRPRSGYNDAFIKWKNALVSHEQRRTPQRH